MEEVWKDINLSCLQDRPSTTLTNSNNHHAFPGMILQDFLARPFEKDSPISSSLSPVTTTTQACPSEHDLFLNSSMPRPATALSLNNSSSGSDHFQHIENRPTINHHHHLHSHSRMESPPSFNICAFDALGGSSSCPSLFPASNICKKRPQENNENENSGDRRHKRMIKNRESAARSRARKQAYTHELELEVAYLLEENARLRRQQEKFLAAPAAQLIPKKNTLHRASTAPF